MKILTQVKSPNTQSRRGRHFLAAVVIALLLIPTGARAAGLSDILSLLMTISGTLQNAIGGVLNQIQSLNTTVNNFRQTVIWPVNQINQTKQFINSTQAQYQGVMSRIQSLKNNSATLLNPAQLESIFRSTQAANVAQLQPAYAGVYGPLPSPSDARLAQRNLMDMDDAMAMGSLKTAVISDQATQGTLRLADRLEQQSAAAASGSAPMLAAQAQIAELETQAQLAKVLAAELRQEAARLAHQNVLIKQSAATARNLQNQAQQILNAPQE